MTILFIFLIYLLSFALKANSQSEEWVPYIPHSDAVELNYWEENDTSYVKVSICFSSSGYKVSDWGTPVIEGNNIFVDTMIWHWAGWAAQVIINMYNIYNLGNLKGTYLFI